jgi:hypothetical protein
MFPTNVGFPVKHAVSNVIVGVVPPVWLLNTLNCRMAANPTRVIPDTRAHITTAPVPASPVTSIVTVIDAGDDGTNWFDTKQYNVSADVDFTAVVTFVNVIEFAEAVTDPAATVPDTAANTTNKSPAVGVNDVDAYVVTLLVSPVAANAFVTAATDYSSQTTPTVQFTVAAAVRRIRQNDDVPITNSRPSGAM